MPAYELCLTMPIVTFCVSGSAVLAEVGWLRVSCATLLFSNTGTFQFSSC